MSDRGQPLPPPPQLPTAAGPQPAHPPQPARRSYALAPPAWQALRERARASGLRPAAVLACAFGDVLANWCKTPRFALVFAERVGDDGEWTLLDVDADPDTPFAERARNLQQQMAAAAPPENSPGLVVFTSRLADERQRPNRVDSGDGGSVLVPTNGDAALTSINGEAALAPGPHTERWLVCEVSEAGGALVVSWETRDDVFPAGLVDDMVAAYAELLERLAVDPAAWTHAPYEYLPERQRLVREQVNATARSIPPALLHEPFWDQAQRGPDAPAVIAEDRTLTYRELCAGATALAARLRELGARPNRLVAIVMEKGWEQPLAALGVLESGAAYVPLAPDLPAERLAAMLAHAEVEIAVVQPHLAGTLAWPAGIQLVAVDDGLLAGAGSRASGRVQRTTDLAYVIYTSGSTGQPKGVMIDHAAAVNTVAEIDHRFAVGAHDRVLALSSLSFDLSVYDVFGLLAVGGAVVMPPPHASHAPWTWLDLMVEHRVTVWDTVPALMEMLVGYAQGRDERLPRSLRLVLMSGDWIPVSLPARIRALAEGEVDIIGMGGATEASIWSNFYRIGEVGPSWASIPYGKPLANQRFEVLDGAFRRRPDWVPGELYIGGAGLALGYWHDEEKTRAAFVRHPRTGERLYRTGDLGRYLPDGNLEFLGREDSQVKIHGYRVELGEIEAALLSHAGVAAAVAMANRTPNGERRLVAYVTRSAVNGTVVSESGVPLGSGTPRGTKASPDGDAELVRAIRTHLSAKLPAYMVPAYYAVLDALPLTGNGKVDRNALAEHAGVLAAAS